MGVEKQQFACAHLDFNVMLPECLRVLVIDFVVCLENAVDTESADQHISVRGEAHFVLSPGPGLGRDGEETLHNMFGARILDGRFLK
jgi:hypothetical protein